MHGAMEYRSFGETGWSIGAVGVSYWQFGGAIMLDGRPDGWTGVSDEESAAIIQRAVELRINFFDTPAGTLPPLTRKELTEIEVAFV